MDFIKDINPKLKTGSAIIVGYILLDDLDSIEQNILGNWLMLVAQVLCTNAYFKQEEEKNKPTNKNINKKDEIEILKKMIKAINKEISNLENDLNY